MSNMVSGTVFLLEKDFTAGHIEESFRKMRKLSFNTVVLWPPVFYNGEKHYFDVHMTALDLAEKHGLKVVIELTGQVPNLEYMPDFMHSPEYMTVNELGQPELDEGGLGELNYNHPTVKSIMKSFFREMVAAYKSHPALKAWDIWNETHFCSFDKHTIAEFQKWLKRKYNGDIDKLNFAWNKTYTCFNQIRRDARTWGSICPETDWELFRCDNLAAITKELADVIHEADDEHPVIADNVMANTVLSGNTRGTDDWKVAESVDTYGISFYPKTGGRILQNNISWERCLTFAGAASAGNGNFIISEMQSHTYSDLYSISHVTAEDITTWNLEAMAHGCRGVIYWKWAPFTQGIQVGGRGLVLADGGNTPRAEAAGKAAKFMDENPEIENSKPADTRAAVLFDMANVLGIKAINNAIRHVIGNTQAHESLAGLYSTAFEKDIPLAVCSRGQLSETLKKSEILFMPYQPVLDGEGAQLVEKFVSEGGTLIAGYPFADIMENGRLHTDLPGGKLNAMLGIRHIDTEYIKGVKAEFEGGASANIDTDMEIELVEMDASANVKTLANAGEFPLLLSRDYGKGRILYFTSPIWKYNSDELRKAAFEFISKDLLPEFVRGEGETRAITRETESADFVFAINYAGEAEISLTCQKAKGKKAELVFGDGKLTQSDEKISIKGCSAGYVIKLS